MDIAALVTWVLTAGGGFVLLGIWVSKGGLRREPAESRFPPAVLFGHFLLAAAGLLVWIGFLLSDDSAGLAWTAFGLLVPVALLGLVLLLRWWRGRQEAATVTAVDAPVPAEQRFPLPVVAAHGLLAVTTVVLVVLAAIDIT